MAVRVPLQAREDLGHRVYSVCRVILEVVSAGSREGDEARAPAEREHSMVQV